MQCPLTLIVLIFVSFSTHANGEKAFKRSQKVYSAEITEIPGTSSGVTGQVTVFQPDETGLVGYIGTSLGLAPGLQSSTCLEKNGCGVHIHSGSSCLDSEGQGGHLFFDPIAEDPWTEERYDSDEEGAASYSGILNMGFGDLDGRAFVVHAEDGSRLGCGTLKLISNKELFLAQLAPIEGASRDNVTGDVRVTLPSDDGPACFFGRGRNLEPNIQSGVNGRSGSDCMEKNGCGTHIHSGYSCVNVSTQLGHFFDGNVVASDPWEIVHYESTDEHGNAAYIGCVKTGNTAYNGRAFVMHANDGSRLACGLLSSQDDENEEDDKKEDDSGSIQGKNGAIVSTVVLSAVSMCLLFIL